MPKGWSNLAFTAGTLSCPVPPPAKRASLSARDIGTKKNTSSQARQRDIEPPIVLGPVVLLLRKILAANEALASNVASTSRSTESVCRPGGPHYVAASPRWGGTFL